MLLQECALSYENSTISQNIKSKQTIKNRKMLSYVFHNIVSLIGRGIEKIRSAKLFFLRILWYNGNLINAKVNRCLSKNCKHNTENQILFLFIRQNTF